MSRAFTKENDGWSFCIKEHQACLFSDEQDECTLDICKKLDSKEKNEKGQKSVKTYGTIRLQPPD